MGAIKSENDKRTHCVSSRFNQQELALLDQYREDIPKGEYVRRAVINNPPRPIPRPNREQYMETARWASCLNQIAHHLNMAGFENSAEEVGEIMTVLREFRTHLIGVEWDES